MTIRWYTDADRLDMRVAAEERRVLRELEDRYSAPAGLWTRQSRPPATARRSVQAQPMDPVEEIHGAEPRRFLRLVYDFEVEVTDPTQAAAYTMDWGRDEAGEPGMMPYSNQNEQMHAAVSQALAAGLVAAGQQAGFKWLGGSLLPRRVGEDGRYSEFPLPSMPVRREDGSID
ncbi:hypothetical protein SAMN06893096_103236 [Geodermatophilus pulveris]|uniref:Uncharacterized protein n=1 Tax=Geodermatophilus pulveris TaxID=1564159 RepID=A0A239DLM9_9ACTN|nr:hypothetical protein [Geodermatophilus pulveris]SNS32758.1 hypothetical protein SAMN06893096_103236 [Geodermatophilus pulveris]